MSTAFSIVAGKQNRMVLSLSFPALYQRRHLHRNHTHHNQTQTNPLEHSHRAT